MGALDDLAFMQRALAVADEAADAVEVPVGAVLVRADAVLATAGNAAETEYDPTAHAEIRVLRAAATAQGNYRLPGSTLFVTLEPCTMCVGAIVHARIARVVFAATDPKSGALGGALDVLGQPGHNHRPVVAGGVLGDAAGDRLRAFFRARRGRSA